MYRKFILLLIFGGLIASCSPSQKYLSKQGDSYGEDSAKVKVLLFKSDAPVTISSKTRLKISDLKNRNILYNNVNRSVKVYPEKLNNAIIAESWESPLIFNDQPYRGIIELHNVSGKIYVINELSIEEYLQGVVPSEMNGSWHIEALKAQAIAARTYAYYMMLQQNKGLFDLDSTTSSQVYKGISVETELANQAVRESKGMIMTYENKPILAVFHSTSGGSIIGNSYVWGGEQLPYLADKPDPYSTSSPHYQWSTEINMYDLRQKLGIKYGSIGEIKGISFRRHNDRVVEVVISHTNGKFKITGNEFRLLLGAEKVKSQLFKAAKTKDGLRLDGRGFGHGVGMCQYSAKEMAEKGAKSEQILKFFYKDITLTSM